MKRLSSSRGRYAEPPVPRRRNRVPEVTGGDWWWGWWWLAGWGRVGSEVEVEVVVLGRGGGGEGVVFSASHWRKRERASQSV